MAGRPSKRGPEFVKAGSGIQPDGSWVPVFAGQRPPFRGGEHETHGSYVSAVRLSTRATEIADAVRPFLPSPSPAAETILAGYAITWTRIERGIMAIEQAEASDDPAQAERLRSLEKDVRLWLGRALEYARELGLTPAALARIYRDSALGKSQSAQAALREHLAEHYASDGDGNA